MKVNMNKIRTRAAAALAAMVALFQPRALESTSDSNAGGKWSRGPGLTRFRDGSKKRENKSSNRKKAKAARTARKAQR